MTRKEQVVEPLTPEYPEDAVVRIEDMGPVELAYALAMHEDCEDEPKGHHLSEHSPWSGGDLDGVEPWPSFVARLARHGLTLTLDAARTASVAGLDRERLADLRQTIRDGVEAFRLTREYVGEDTLPAIEGWSWFDWTQKALAAFNSAPSIEQEPGLCAATNPTETWGVMWCGLYAGHPLGGPDNGHHWFSDRVTPQPRAADAE